MNSSKIVLFFCAFAVFSALTEAVLNASAVDIEAMVKMTIQRCEKELEVDAKDVEKLDAGLAVPENLKCMRACFMKGLGLMKEDGTIKKDNLSNIVPDNVPERVEIIAGLRSCSEKTKGTDACELANSFNACVNNDLQGRLQKLM